MLVLTRRLGEKITINNGEIIITVVQIKGKQIRLGIKAPQGTPIHRDEVQQEIDNDKINETRSIKEA